MTAPGVMYNYVLSVLSVLCVLSANAVLAQKVQLTQCTRNASLPRCPSDHVHYCFPDQSRDGCYPPVRCPPGSVVKISENTTANASQAWTLACHRCPEGQTSKLNNSLECETTYICPDGQVPVEKSGDVVGDAKCREEEKPWNLTNAVWIICGLTGAMFAGIITWRCVRYFECYRKRVHEAKSGRHACASFCRRRICCCCCAPTAYGTDGDTNNTEVNGSSSSHQQPTSASSNGARENTAPPHEVSAIRTASKDPGRPTQEFQNLAYSDHSLDKY